VRGPKTALIAGVVVTAATATIFKAQQMYAASSAAATTSASAEAGSDPSLAQRSARQLLRNGLDYLDTYQDHERALVFLREAQSRPDGLDEKEVKALADGLDRAQAAQAEAGPAVAVARRSVVRRPIGSVASSSSRRPKREALASAETEPIRRVSAEKVEPAEPPAMDLPELPATMPIPAAPPSDPPAGLDEPPSLGTPESSRAVSMVKPAAKAAVKPAAPKTAAEPIYLTSSAQDEPPKADAPKAPADAPASRPEPAPAEPPILPVDEVPAPSPARVPAPDPSSAPRPAPADNPSAPARPTADAPPLADAPPVIDSPAAVPAPAPVPTADPFEPEPAKVVGSPRPATPARASSPSPASRPTERRDAAAAAVVNPVASRIPTPAPAPEAEAEAEELPPLPPASRAIPGASTEAETGLPPDAAREVKEIARRQDEALRRNPIQPFGSQMPSDITTSGPTEVGSASRLVLPRAPSPTEPRPIRVIPVPEEFTPLPARRWDPNRKYWVAAATCHMPLYFQDAVLERYGQGVEQAIGPNGRYFSYPLDDPRQTNQRNQLLQPVFSAGLFLGQIAMLPYNMLMDPPWEAEYDLGYYRPGDKIPADTYYLPKTGVGPPLQGPRY
jgi:hypothetical protein